MNKKKMYIFFLYVFNVCEKLCDKQAPVKYSVSKTCMSFINYLLKKGHIP